MEKLRDQVAVVTGAASGIGRALAERFAAEGMKVVLADLDDKALAEVEAEMRAAGRVVLAVSTDVSRRASLDALAARTQETFGPVHVLCNNAGVGGVGGLLWTLTEKDWAWTLSVNLWGVIHGIAAFVPSMIAHGGHAHVVNTASMAGLGSPPFMGPYVATKHAVVSLSEVLARDLQAVGAKVKVSVLCPGFVKTNIAESERSRPADLRNESGNANPVAVNMKQAVRQLVDAGIPPARVADAVVEALYDQRFYVLPHPELKGMVGERLQDILQDRYPRYDPDTFNQR